MKSILLLILTILSKTPFVILSKCKNPGTSPNVTCIELCCDMWQFYAEDSKKCEYVMEYDKPSWIGFLRNMTETEQMNFIKYGKCSQTMPAEHSIIDKCYSTDYDVESKVYILKQYSNVPCDRLPNPNTLLVILLFEHIFLGLMLFHTCTKKDKKDHLSYKLITWYLVSVIANLCSSLLWYYIEQAQDTVVQPQDSPLIYMFFLHEFFAASTMLSLSCIGYSAYARFMEFNVQTTERNEQKRFICFAIYVWGGSLMVYIIAVIIKSAVVSHCLVYLIGFFNIFVFLVLSLKICLIRCRITTISNEKHIKCKIARIICRLCILMGILRMLSLILDPVTGIYPIVVMVFLEPFLVYGTFIAENENCYTLFRCKCCCSADSHNEAKEKVMENTTMTSTTSV